MALAVAAGILAGVRGQTPIAVNFQRGCDTGSSALWLGNGVWKDGVRENCEAGSNGCCDANQIQELLEPPSSSDGNQPDPLCPAKADNLTDCRNKQGSSCECDHPQTFTVVDDITQSAAFTLSEGQWRWFSFSVAASQITNMVGVDWNLTISNTDPDIQAALLVGRCLGEVECGKCPPRCATLQSARRTPQVCTLTDYCPGYSPAPDETNADGSPSKPAWKTDPLDSSRKLAVCYNATTNEEKTCNWFGLKKKTDADADPLELEDVHFYVGVFGMSGNGTYTDVSATLRLKWNPTSFAIGVCPRVALVALASLFVMLIS